MNDPKTRPAAAPDDGHGDEVPETEPIAIEEPEEPGDPDAQPI